MSILVVDIWFHYSKASNCCVEIRSLLDDGSGLVCPPAAFTAPCREFTGNCADTIAQFSSVPGAIPPDYECHQARERPFLYVCGAGALVMLCPRFSFVFCGRAGGAGFASCGPCATYSPAFLPVRFKYFPL